MKMYKSKINRLVKFFLTLAFVFLLKQSFNQTINTFPYSESFESGLGAWVNKNAFVWQTYSGPTPTANTGPDAAQDGLNYLYIEGDDGLYNKTAIIELSLDFTNVSQPIISFQYHRYGTRAGYLWFQMSIDNGTTWIDSFNVLNENENLWKNKKICLDELANKSNVKIRFKASTQDTVTTDIAIDNIQIIDFKFLSIPYTNPSCDSDTTGTITVNVAGGFSPYSYSIDENITYISDANLSHTFSDLLATDYPIVVTDAAGCDIYGSTIQLTAASLSPIVSSLSTPVYPCFYDNNGSITITAITGFHTYPPFQYSIDGGTTYNFSNSFADLEKDTFDLIVKNSMGCLTDAGSIIVSGPPNLEILDTFTVVTNVEGCYGEQTGSILVEAAGNAPIEYSINNDDWETQGFFQSLAGGNSYQVYIRDKVGCTIISEVFNITQPELLEINSITSQDVIGCYGAGTGSISINASGGTPPLWYSINGGSSYSTSSNFAGLYYGLKTIKVKDSHNCQQPGGNITIEQPPLLKIDNVVKQNVSGCVGFSNGEIIITSSGGTAPVLYSIDGINYQSSNVFSGLNTGTYNPSVKDFYECIDTDNEVTITQPTQLEINSVNVTNVSTCHDGNNGMIEIYATNGTPQYQYSIDGGVTFSTNNVFTTLTAGSYQVVVKDFFDCSANGLVYYITAPDSIVVDTVIYDNVSCFGGNDATIYVEASGGSGQLKYSVDNGLNFQYSCGGISYHSAGNYNIVVKDIKNCQVTDSSFTITQPEQLLIESIDTVHIEGCYGDDNGSITINAIGGTLPILYSLDNGLTSQTSNVFSSLSAGIDFIPQVSDYNGCIHYLDPIVLTEPNNLYVINDEHTNIHDCKGSATGTVTITANGGTLPLFYSIDNGLTFFENNGLFTNLTAGTYNIAVKDSHDCLTFGFEEIITEPTQMKFDSIVAKDIICHGQSNGQLFVYASGGQMPLKYSINGEAPLQSFQYLGMYPGTFTIEAIDSYNCTIDSFATIYEPDTLILNPVQFTNVTSCYGNNEGTITILATGGVPELLYSYCNVPNPPQPYTTTTYYENLPSGYYYVVVKDQNGCTKSSDLFSISAPNPVSLTSWNKTDIDCFGNQNGELHFSAIGGSGVYTYTIDNGATWTSSNGDYVNMGPGTYICGAKDENGCFSPSGFKTMIIYEPTQLEFSNVIEYDITCNNSSDGGIAIYGQGGTIPYQFAINNGTYQYDRTFGDLPPGEYTPYIQDANGCLVIGEPVTFTNPDKYSYFSASVDTGCSPLSVKFFPENTFVAFEWKFGDGGTSMNISPTHIFENEGSLTQQFTVTGIAYYQGCKDSSDYLITVRPLPYLDFLVDENLKYFPDTVFYITNFSQSGYSDYYWNFGDGQIFNSESPDFHPYSDCGEYTITMSASNEFCRDTISKSVTLTTTPPGANFSLNENMGCAPVEVEFINQSSGALSYLWDFGDGNTFDVVDTSYIFEAQGDYFVQLTAYGYCNTSTSFSKEINIYENPISNFNVEPDTVVIEQTVKFFEDCIFTDSYFWMFGDGDISTESMPIHLYSEPGLYDVTLIATSVDGCTDTLLMKNAVTVADNPFVVFPTAFSPNGDNHNDYFIPIYGQILDVELMIFDRWGKMVYKTDDISNYWDGRSLDGNYCEQGVYVWMIEGKYLSGKIFITKGEVTIIR